jgi:RNA polymerase sigma-70 factor (ECF subfamily)
MAEMAWVRRLARAPVKDAALADDITQDAWIVAAEQEPDADRPLRPWLARVVTNLVRTRRVSASRRDRRDAAFDDGRTVPTPAELVERIELQRAVADEVLALAEPYRSTVLLHFFEGHTSAEIARRLEIPDGTVRRRLKVALDQLRDALRKRTDQPKGGWLAALIPFARLPGPTPASTGIGAIAMKVIGVVVLGLLLVAGAGAVWWRHASGGRSSSIDVSGAGDRSQASRVNSESSRPTAIPAWIPQAGAPPRRIAGRVTFQGAPVAGARVSLGLGVVGEARPFIMVADDVPTGVQLVAELTSAPDGTFDFGVQPAASLIVSASANNFAAAAITVNNADPRSSSEQLSVQLGDCRSRLSGMIADAGGGGIAMARLSVAALSGTESDATGHYSLCLPARDVDGTPSVVVRVEADGFGTVSQTVIAVGDLHHDFLLAPEAVLVGRVTTSDGEPVAGARVVAMAEPREIPHSLGSRWTDSDHDGRFRISGLGAGAFQVEASAKALPKATVHVVARPAETSREIHVVLPRTPLARVVGHIFRKGAPASGVAVMPVQPGAPPLGGSISQADGSFTFAELPYGVTSFFAAPNQAGASKEIDIAQPLVNDVRIDITHAATVRGHVTRQGKPVVGADIAYTPAPQATFYGPPPMAKTDSNGAFTLELPLGVGQLVAWDNAGKAFANPSAAISLNGSSAGVRAARTSVTNSSAFRIGTAGVRIARKSCVVASSMPGITFLPATPSTLMRGREHRVSCRAGDAGYRSRIARTRDTPSARRTSRAWRRRRPRPAPGARPRRRGSPSRATRDLAFRPAFASRRTSSRSARTEPLRHRESVLSSRWRQASRHCLTPSTM